MEFRVLDHLSQWDSSKLDRYFMLSLILTIPSIPFGRFSIGGFEIPLAIAIIVIYVLCKFLLIIRDPVPNTVRPLITTALAFLLAWSGVTLLWARDSDLALSRLVTRSCQLLFCTVVINFCILGPVAMHKLSRLMPAVILIPVMIGYYGYFVTADPLHYQFSYEFPRYLGDRNSDTFMILTGLPFALVMPLTGAYGFWWSLFGLIASLLMAGAIFLSLSRANFLVMVLIIAIVVSLSQILKKERVRSLMLISAVCVTLPLFAIAIPTDRLFKTVTQYEKRFDEAHDDNRWELAWGGLELAARYPITGVGLNNFSTEFHSTSVGRFWHRWEKQKPESHNSFLSVWVESGTPALIAFLVIMSWPFACLLRLFPAIKRREDPLFLALFLTSLGLGLVLIQGIVAYNFADIFFFWVAYSLNAQIVLALDRSLRNNSVQHLTL